MEKRKRGILSFMGEQNTQGQVVMVPLHKIEANPQQPRKIFNDESIAELTGSIKEYGVLQPIILRDEKNDTYTIIAGERRYRASQLAGLEKIPAIIRTMETKEAALIALVENVQREDLNFLEEARAYKKLMEDFELTQGEIAEKVNKRQSTISNKIRVLSLPEKIQEQLILNRLTERHARALLKLKDEVDRDQVMDRVIANGLNVKQTEKLIEDVLQKKEEALRKRRKVNYISYKIYLNTIRKAFRQIKEMEENAKISQEDKGDFLEVKIILPKNDRCFT
jgi:ParB family chromosome partitioning protein